MNVSTLVTAWTPRTSPFFHIAEEWVLGPYTIQRQVGEGYYTLARDGDAQRALYSNLREARVVGAELWAQDIAEKLTANQLAPEDAERIDEDLEGADDIRIEDNGSISLVRPLTRKAKDWIDENVQDDAQWFGRALVVEPRYLPFLVSGMVEEGLRLSSG